MALHTAKMAAKAQHKPQEPWVFTGMMATMGQEG
jgi:hypothetical protein